MLSPPDGGAQSLAGERRIKMIMCVDREMLSGHLAGHEAWAPRGECPHVWQALTCPHDYVSMASITQAYAIADWLQAKWQVGGQWRGCGLINPWWPKEANRKWRDHNAQLFIKASSAC